MELTVNGSRVRATTGGRPLNRDLPLLIFIHGAGMDRTVWSLQTRYFASHGWAVLAVDLPGHSGSEGPARKSISDYAAWALDCIAATGWERAALIGHSMGSFIALHAAGNHPEAVSHLGLLGTAASMPVHRDLLAAAERGDHRAFELVVDWSFGQNAHLGGHKTPGLWMLGGGTRLLEHVEAGVLHDDLVATASYDDAIATAALVDCPTLVLLGERDRMTPGKAAMPLIEALRDVTTVKLGDCGHLMTIEQPDLVIDTLAAFLHT